MKMYEIIELAGLYTKIKDCKMPLKTTYKFSKLMRQVEKEQLFYQEELNKIIQDYARIEDGKIVYSQDKTSILIIPGKEQECNNKIFELKNLEIEIKDVKFSFEELEQIENLELTVAEMTCLFPLLEN